MSLLTEEQIKEIDMMRFRFNEYHFKNELEKWNEKQQPAQPLSQFEQKWSKEPIYVQEWDAKKQPIDVQPDWSKAPKNAKFWVLKVMWIDANEYMLSERSIALCEKPAPVITPHPHAAMMLKYAEVAARRVDPWVEFESKNTISGKWEKPISCISFFSGGQYRYIGKTK